MLWLADQIVPLSGVEAYAAKLHVLYRFGALELVKSSIYALQNTIRDDPIAMTVQRPLIGGILTDYLMTYTFSTLSPWTASLIQPSSRTLSVFPCEASIKLTTSRTHSEAF